VYTVNIAFGLLFIDSSRHQLDIYPGTFNITSTTAIKELACVRFLPQGLDEAHAPHFVMSFRKIESKM